MAATDEIEPMLSVATVAKLTDRSRGWVYKQMAAGRISAVVELGDKRQCQRIPLSAYKAFIKSRTYKTANS